MVDANITTYVADASPIQVYIDPGAGLTTVSRLTAGSYGTATCSGTSGETGRVINAVGSVQLLVLDNSLLHPTVDYSTTGSIVTFNTKVWDGQKLTIWT